MDNNYIVRIYRCDDRPRGIVGVVEEIGTKGKKAFTSYDELWDILKPRQGERTAGGGEYDSKDNHYPQGSGGE